jgi:hypothetical protein
MKKKKKKKKNKKRTKQNRKWRGSSKTLHFKVGDIIYKFISCLTGKHAAYAL